MATGDTGGSSQQNFEQLQPVSQEII